MKFAVGYIRTGVFLLTLCLGPQFFWQTCAIAQQEKISSEETHYSVELPRLADVQTPEHAGGSLDQLFSMAMADIRKNDIAAASEKLDLLKQQSIAQGYLGLNGFSDELLRYAALEQKNVDLATKSFLVRRAVELSPNSGRVLISAAAFLDVFSAKTVIKLVWDGFGQLLDTPLSFSKLGINTLFLVLVALTLSFLITCSLQIVSHRDRLFGVISNRLSLRMRGLATPLLLMAVVTLPLWGGILFALGCWSLLLSRCLKHCRMLCWCCAMVIISWSMAVPVIQTVGLNSGSNLLQVVQDLNQRSYAPQASKTLEKAMSQNPRSPLFPFSLGLVEYRQGTFSKSEEFFRAALLHPQASAALKQAALVNIAVNQYDMKNFAEAKESLLAARSESFDTIEIVYNLAQVEAALTDTEKFREYYTVATEMDRQAVEAYDASMRTKASLVSMGVPDALIYRTFTSDIRSLNENVPYATFVNLREKVLGALFVGGSPLAMGVFGILIIVLSALSSESKRKRVIGGLAEPQPTQPSLVWAMVPAGLVVVSDKPVQGACLLSIIVCALMLGYQQPVQMIHILPTPVFPTSVWLMIAAAFAVSLSLLEVVARVVNMPKGSPGVRNA